MRGVFDRPRLEARHGELEREAENPQLWDDPARAQKILQEQTRIQERIDRFADARKKIQDLKELFPLALEDADLLGDYEGLLKDTETFFHDYRLDVMMSGEADDHPCFLEIHAGAGGTEAQDWAHMLLRMYSRWVQRRGFRLETVDVMNGEEAGIKSATLRIQGAQAYGWLKMEAGVHRLVRISPFDSNKRRHTSFASVSIYPDIEDDIEIVIEDKDLRVDTYRASGAGGQHVNKTESAIRITHLPTGVVVQCQSDRSQHRNRAQAMTMLKARLYALEQQKKTEQTQAANSQKTDMGWGHQIRSYVMQPYQMVKDSRTSVETSQVHDVLDGELDAFLEAALIHQQTQS